MRRHYYTASNSNNQEQEYVTKDQTVEDSNPIFQEAVALVQDDNVEVKEDLAIQNSESVANLSVEESKNPSLKDCQRVSSESYESSENADLKLSDSPVLFKNSQSQNDHPKPSDSPILLKVNQVKSKEQSFGSESLPSEPAPIEKEPKSINLRTSELDISTKDRSLGFSTCMYVTLYAKLDSWRTAERSDYIRYASDITKQLLLVCYKEYKSEEVQKQLKSIVVFWNITKREGLLIGKVKRNKTFKEFQTSIKRFQSKYQLKFTTMKKDQKFINLDYINKY